MQILRSIYSMIENEFLCDKNSGTRSNEQVFIPFHSKANKPTVLVVDEKIKAISVMYFDTGYSIEVNDQDISCYVLETAFKERGIQKFSMNKCDFAHFRDLITNELDDPRREEVLKIIERAAKQF